MMTTFYGAQPCCFITSKNISNYTIHGNETKKKQLLNEKHKSDVDDTEIKETQVKKLLNATKQYR